MKRMFLIIALMIIMYIIIVFSYSCIPIGDGGIGVTGTVYEWVDAPVGEASMIYVEVCDTREESRAAVKNIIANVTNDITKRPLEDAVVAVGYADAIEDKGEEGYDYKVHTRPDGSFEESWMVAALRSQLHMKVAKPEYMAVVKDAEFSGANYYAIVAILVRGNNSN